MSAIDAVRYEDALHEIIEELKKTPWKKVTPSQLRIRRIAESVLSSVHRAQSMRDSTYRSYPEDMGR